PRDAFELVEDGIGTERPMSMLRLAVAVARQVVAHAGATRGGELENERRVSAEEVVEREPPGDRIEDGEPQDERDERSARTAQSRSDDAAGRAHGLGDLEQRQRVRAERIA